MNKQMGTCTICGKPATVYGYFGATMVPRCADHGVQHQIRSQADIDHIAALEAERDALREAMSAPSIRQIEIQVELHTKLSEREEENKRMRALLSGLNNEVAILAFARLLAKKLHTKKNEAKGDWRAETPVQHLYGLYDEEHELTREFVSPKGNGLCGTKARWEAVDVALRAMMLCDVLAPLCEHDGRGRATRSQQRDVLLTVEADM